MLYYCKAPNLVVGLHQHEQNVDPIVAYGIGCYVIVDYLGPSPVMDITTGKYPYPTITTQMHTDSVKWECQRRILLKVSANVQRNLTAYQTQLQQNVVDQIPLTPAQEQDIQTCKAIWSWVGRPNGMQGTSDNLIATNDPQWWLDGKWPTWNAAWDDLINRA